MQHFALVSVLDGMFAPKNCWTPNPKFTTATVGFAVPLQVHTGNQKETSQSQSSEDLMVHTEPVFFSAHLTWASILFGREVQSPTARSLKMHNCFEKTWCVEAYHDTHKQIDESLQVPGDS